MFTQSKPRIAHQTSLSPPLPFFWRKSPAKSPTNTKSPTALLSGAKFVRTLTCWLLGLEGDEKRRAKQGGTGRDRIVGRSVVTCDSVGSHVLQCGDALDLPVNGERTEQQFAG